MRKEDEASVGGRNRVFLNELEATLIDILVLENYHVADNKQ